MKKLKEKFVDIDERLDIVNETVEDDRTIEDLKKDHPNEIENLEEALLKYMGENDLKVLKTGFPDKWKYITKKLVCPYEYFNSIEAYQKSVSNLKKEDFFSKLNNKCPDNEEIQRTKENIERFDIKNGEELTEIYLKSDILLLTCVFEKAIKVSVNEIGNNPLYSVPTKLYLAVCNEIYRKKLTNTSR